MSHPACLFGLLIVAGLLLRLNLYWQNLSFWTDEAWVAHNIVAKSFEELVYNPPTFLSDTANRSLGFVLGEKLLVGLFGYQEQIFRLIPFAAGVLALLCFCRLSQYTSSPGSRVFALAFLVFSPDHIHYSSQLKPFSVDVLSGLMIMWLFFRARKSGYQRQKMIALALGGVVLLWFSFSALFIFPGILLALLFDNRRPSAPGRIISIIIVGAAWLLSSIEIFFCRVQPILNDTALYHNWQDSFVADQHWIQGGIWLAQAFFGFLTNTVTSYPPAIVFVVLVLGVIAFMKKDKVTLLLCLTPVLVVAWAAWLGKYPFSGRVLLFLTPYLFILLGEGLAMLFSRQSFLRNVLASVLAFSLLVPSLVSAIGSLGSAQDFPEGNREALAVLAQQYQPGDIMMINHLAETPLWYYSSIWEMYPRIEVMPAGHRNGRILAGWRVGRFQEVLSTYQKKEVAVFIDAFYIYNREGYFREAVMRKAARPPFYKLSKEQFPLRLCARRVWFFFSHDRPETRDFILESLRFYGSLIAAYKEGSVALYLFDFTSHPVCRQGGS